MTKALVLFGSTGDLVKQKLVPALAKLARSDLRLIAVGRRPFSTGEYRTFLGLKEGVLPSLEYVQVDISKPETFSLLQPLLASCTTRLFYLAISHAFFTAVVEGIERFGLHRCASPRVVFEKPFGVDGESARALDARLKQLFTEEQLYRVDHYLAKRGVHALLERKRTDKAFAQGITGTHVKEVRILVHEAEGVGARLSYYHPMGALKDMIQNHLLQVLALVLVRLPDDGTLTGLADGKQAVLESLSLGVLSEHLLGQYASYASEVTQAGLLSRTTETFARVTLYSSLPRWEEVPFVLETGKKLNERFACVRIVYKDGTSETIVINPRGEALHEDGYAFLLEELLKGRKTWFAREDEIVEGWRIVDTLETMRKEIRFVTYADGTLPV